MSRQISSELQTVVDEAFSDVREEVEFAMRKWPPLNSPHEGWAVIAEELDELWDHVRANTGRSDEAAHEAVQVAAMAIRYLIDLKDPS